MRLLIVITTVILSIGCNSKLKETKSSEKDVTTNAILKYLENGQIGSNRFIFEEIAFSRSSVKLKKEYTIYIQHLSTILENHNVSLLIEVYSNDTESSDLNKQISIARANAIKTELIKTGMDEDRITTKGTFGDLSIGNKSSRQERVMTQRITLIINP